MEREIHLKNLKKISNYINKSKYIKTKKNRNIIGRKVLKEIKNLGCNPYKVFYSIGNQTRTPINKSPFFMVEKTDTIKKGIAKIGSGKMGDVFMGCIDNECKNKVAIKISTDTLKVEYVIGKKLSLLGGVRMYYYSKCKKADILYSEFHEGGTLRGFMENNKNIMRPIHFRTIVTEVLYNLYKIHKKYPNFRHHDLHADNILINNNFKHSGHRNFKIGNKVLKVNNIGIESVINDFGFSVMKNVENELVDSNDYKSSYGIYRDSHIMYDAHCFLNNVKDYINKYGIISGNETKEFINRIFTEEYKNVSSQNTTKVYKGRLRPVVHRNLPSYTDIFRDRYFLPYTPILTKKTNIVLKNILKIPVSTKYSKVRHGTGTPVNMTKIIQNLRKKNEVPKKVKILKRPGIKALLPPPKNKKISPLPKLYKNNKKGYLKIGTRKCTSYKKDSLISIAKKYNIDTRNKTITQLCKMLDQRIKSM